MIGLTSSQKCTVYTMHCKKLVDFITQTAELKGKFVGKLHA